MLNDYQEIMQKDVVEVIRSPLLLPKLLKLYSTLYLGGAPPKWCERSQRGYYQQLQQSGLKKIEAMSEILNRTCELIPNIQPYISPLAMHVNNSNLTDWIGCECLSKGYLKEIHFAKLPQCWIERETKSEVKEVENILVVNQMKAPKNAYSKKSNRR